LTQVLPKMILGKLQHYHMLLQTRAKAK